MSREFTEEWTEEDCIRLIREYRARPLLWDPKKPFFYKTKIKPDAWEEIGKAIGFSADACKRKMVILMSSFRREKAKTIHSIRDCTDLSDMYKSVWFGFKELAFLMDKDGERKRQANGLTENDDNMPDSVKSAILKYQMSNPTPTPKKIRRRKPTNWTHDKKRLAKLVVKEMRDRAPEVSTSFSTEADEGIKFSSEADEEIKSFTSFIGNKMKRYSETTKNAVQQAICKIIFRADQNVYEHTTPLDSSVRSSTSIDDELLMEGSDVNVTIKQDYSDYSD